MSLFAIAWIPRAVPLNVRYRPITDIQALRKFGHPNKLTPRGTIIPRQACTCAANMDQGSRFRLRSLVSEPTPREVLALEEAAGQGNPALTICCSYSANVPKPISWRLVSTAVPASSGCGT